MLEAISWLTNLSKILYPQTILLYVYSQGVNRNCVKFHQYQFNHCNNKTFGQTDGQSDRQGDSYIIHKALFAGGIINKTFIVYISLSIALSMG